MTALTVVVVVYSVLVLIAVAQHAGELRVDDGSTRSAAPRSGDRLPAFVAPHNLGANCQYPKDDVPAGAPVTPPPRSRLFPLGSTDPVPLARNGSKGNGFVTSGAPPTVGGRSPW